MNCLWQGRASFDGDPERVRIGPVVDELADQLKLSPEDRSELLPSAPADSVQQPRALGEIVFKQSAAR
jgi:hypothetical protein